MSHWVWARRIEGDIISAEQPRALFADHETTPLTPPRVLATDRLLARAADVVTHQWSARDTILYNLGIGFGAAAAAEPGQLRFVLEDRLVSFPSMVAVLGASHTLWQDDSLGIDFAGILHGEESFELTRVLPPEGRLIGRSQVEGVWDRGPQKGAVMTMRKTLHDPHDDAIFATCRSTLMLRRNGGFGGSAEGAPQAASLPERRPDGALELMTRPEQALIYRLSGDTNPLHAVPDAAARAGFAKPILHGLCTYGIAARAIVQAGADGDETRLRRFAVRFSSPVFPGETIRTEYWRLGAGEYAFRALVPERNVVVLTAGRASVQEV
jgi:acyl dehydratase